MSIKGAWAITTGQKVRKGKQELLLMKDVKKLLDNSILHQTYHGSFIQHLLVQVSLKNEHCYTLAM